MTIFIPIGIIIYVFLYHFRRGNQGLEGYGKSKIEILCVEELKSKLAIDGYVYNPEYKLYMYRTVGSDGGTEYGVNCRIGFDKNDSRLLCQVSSGGHNTVEKAVNHAAVSLSSCWYMGEPIAMGKGQANRCKAIALRLASEHATYLRDSHVIVVPYESRGGRGGWKAKIADRRFSVNELLHPVAKPVVPAIMATGNYYSDWRGMWLPKAEKVKIKLVDGKVKMYYMTLEPCVDGELVTLNAKGGPVFRIPLADWQRLQDKANG